MPTGLQSFFLSFFLFICSFSFFFLCDGESVDNMYHLQFYAQCSQCNQIFFLFARVLTINCIRNERTNERKSKIDTVVARLSVIWAKCFGVSNGWVPSSMCSVAVRQTRSVLKRNLTVSHWLMCVCAFYVAVGSHFECHNTTISPEQLKAANYSNWTKFLSLWLTTTNAQSSFHIFSNHQRNDIFHRIDRWTTRNQRKIWCNRFKVIVCECHLFRFHSAVTKELNNTESGDISLVTVGIRSIHMALSIV